MTNGDNFLQYMAGWHAGAGVKSIDPKRANHENKEFAALYLSGWEDGRESSRKASKEASKRFQYEPSIIRTMAEPMFYCPKCKSECWKIDGRCRGCGEKIE